MHRSRPSQVVQVYLVLVHYNTLVGFDLLMWSLTIDAGIIFRAQVQDTLSGVTSNPTILDMTYSGQGASRWKRLFKVRTADLQDFDHGSTAVTLPSKEFAVEVQQALIDTNVHRFALFLAPGVP